MESSNENPRPPRRRCSPSPSPLFLVLLVTCALWRLSPAADDVGGPLPPEEDPLFDPFYVRSTEFLQHMAHAEGYDDAAAARNAVPPAERRKRVRRTKRRLRRLRHSAGDGNSTRATPRRRMLQAARRPIAPPRVPGAAPPPAVRLPIYARGGSHVIYLYVGSSRQRISVILDTGSHFTSFPCAGFCRGDSCGKHEDSYFDPLGSQTGRTVPCGRCRWTGLAHCVGAPTWAEAAGEGHVCEATQKFTEGSSWTAVEYEDEVSLGDEKGIVEGGDLGARFTFGCQLRETGLFRTQFPDGIMGMAMHPSSFPSRLYKAGAVPNTTFSLCLSRSGGTINLGGGAIDARRPMAFTTMRRYYGWYGVSVARMHVGTREIVQGMEGFARAKGTILDSGTTDTFLPESIAAPFKLAWKASTGKKYSTSNVEYTFEEFSKLPRITFTMIDGLEWTLENYDYMEPKKDDDSRKPWEGTKRWISRIYVDERNGAVLGANAMLHRDVFFDAEAGVVGMARADCDY